MKKSHNKILGIEVQSNSKNDVLEKIKKNIGNKVEFFHIASLNSENLVVATELEKFRDVLNQAQVRIIDGAGVLLGCSILNIDCGERVPGVDLMEEVVKMAFKMRLRVLFIGGRDKVAEELSECYSKEYAQTLTDEHFKGISGFKDIRKPTEAETKALFSIVTVYRPHIVFAAFGSPAQELWFWTNRTAFKGVICMGVGGAFDFATGRVSRAPTWMRQAGLEWLYRLIVEPWRWRRQLRLVKFFLLVLKQRLFNKI